MNPDEFEIIDKGTFSGKNVLILTFDDCMFVVYEKSREEIAEWIKANLNHGVENFKQSHGLVQRFDESGLYYEWGNGNPLGPNRKFYSINESFQ